MNGISSTYATQDVEEPEAILGFMRMVLVRPEITGEIQRLIDEGCVWTQDVFWGGSPSEDDLAKNTFWMNFNVQFETQNKVKHWVLFSFRYNESGIVRVELPSNELNLIRCNH